MVQAVMQGARVRAYRVVGLQLGLTALVCVGMMIWQPAVTSRMLVAALCGGLIASGMSAYFARAALVSARQLSAPQKLKALYRAEAVKIFGSTVLLVLMLYVFSLPPAELLLTYILVQLCGSVAFCAFKLWKGKH